MQKITLKSIRKKTGLSQKALAELLLIKQSTVCSYENGDRQVNRKIAYKYIDIAKKHGIQITLENIYPRD